MKKGEPVFHIYLLFILSAFIWGGWKVYTYIKDLEETVQMQQEAIEAQQEQIKLMDLYMRTKQMNMNSPMHRQLYLH